VEKILESNVETSIQLRALISRQPNEPSGHDPATSGHNIGPGTNPTSDASSSNSATGRTSRLSVDQNDKASIRTTGTSFSSQSVQSFTRELFRSRAYKRLNHRRAGANSAGSIYSKDSSATKGDRWSMLSDISLGDLAISEISVLELPICGSDLYDSQPYVLAEEAASAGKGANAQRRGVLPWPSRGRIHTAIRTNDDFVLRTLITLGADLEEKDSEGYTPLIVAIRNRNPKVCRTLLNIGVEVDTRDSSGITPLIHAIKFRDDNPDDILYINQGLQLKLCELLVDAGAAVDTPDSSGRTPLSYAAGCQTWGELRLCEFLIGKGAGVDTPDSSGRTPLSYAVCSQSLVNISLCKLFVDKGAAVDSPDSSGRTPLSYAICARVFDNHETCKFLVDKGAAVDAPDSTGRTPLSYAVSAGNQWRNFKLLVDKGAAVDTPDSSGRTPLSYGAATPFGRTTVKITKSLVARGAEVDTCDSSGRTPLSYAVTARGLAALAISKILVGSGAKVDIPDLSGRTPLSYVAATSAYVSREIIRANIGREVSSRLKGRAPPLTSHIFNDTRIALCTLLLDKGAQVDTNDSSGHSPYWYAREANNNEICQFLAKKGAKQDI